MGYIVPDLAIVLVDAVKLTVVPEREILAGVGENPDEETAGKAEIIDPSGKTVSITTPLVLKKSATVMLKLKVKTELTWVEVDDDAAVMYLGVKSET